MRNEMNCLLEIEFHCVNCYNKSEFIRSSELAVLYETTCGDEKFTTKPFTLLKLIFKKKLNYFLSTHQNIFNYLHVRIFFL